MYSEVDWVKLTVLIIPCIGAILFIILGKLQFVRHIFHPTKFRQQQSIFTTENCTGHIDGLLYHNPEAF